MTQPHHRPDLYTIGPLLNSAIAPFMKFYIATYRLSGFTAVNAVDLTIYRGELFALWTDRMLQDHVITSARKV